MISTLDAFAVGQGLLGARVFSRMLASAAGDPIVETTELPSDAGSVVALVPVLNEALRLAPCLEGLLAQPAALVSIVVIDGGSDDGTRDIVRRFAARDARVRLVDAAPVPPTWNGKIWNLSCGLAASDPTAEWILTIDADVRPGPNLIASLLSHAASAYLDAFSAAPLLQLSGSAEETIHPAFLATLVYRFGMPGNVARNANDVQANGQCFLVKRKSLVETNAIAAAKTSRSDDVTIARHLVRSGASVGFFEGGALSYVEMYASASDAWQNWPRSLPMRDAQTAEGVVLSQLAEVVLVQALPLVAVLAVLATRGDTSSLFFRINLALALARLGVLAGTRRAYARPGLAYWASIFADVPATIRLAQATFALRAVWRGRELVRDRAPAMRA